MSQSTIEVIRRHCRPMAPQATETSDVLRPLGNIRAVLFDIYGTLLISGAGDITLQTGTSSDDAFREALIEGGISQDTAESLSADLLQQTIAEHHNASRVRGIDYPEVDIIAVWQDVLARLAAARSEGPLSQPIDVERLAVEYEVRTNPVWPMPDTLECLRDLKQRGMSLGIISNAQDMTLDLFPALLDQRIPELGFQPDLQFFSYRFGESKPGRAMFEGAVAALDVRGIKPQEAVFVGNDMLKDVWAAAQVGFRTILFAGDARSLRLRPDDDRTRDFLPDAVVTDLASISACLSSV